MWQDGFMKIKNFQQMKEYLFILMVNKSKKKEGHFILLLPLLISPIWMLGVINVRQDTAQIDIIIMT